MEYDLKINKFNNKDLKQVLDLHRKAMEIIGTYKGEGPWDDDLKDIENHYLNNYGIFLVGKINKKIVTMGALRKIDNNIAEIKRMRTYPEYQGKGFGKLILLELINFARKNHYKELILETSYKQLKARKLYINTVFRKYKNEIIDGFKCTWFKLKL